MAEREIATKRLPQYDRTITDADREQARAELVAGHQGIVSGGTKEGQITSLSGIVIGERYQEHVSGFSPRSFTVLSGPESRPDVSIPGSQWVVVVYHDRLNVVKLSLRDLGVIPVSETGQLSLTHQIVKDDLPVPDHRALIMQLNSQGKYREVVATLFMLAAEDPEPMGSLAALSVAANVMRVRSLTLENFGLQKGNLLGIVNKAYGIRLPASGMRAIHNKSLEILDSFPCDAS